MNCPYCCGCGEIPSHYYDKWYICKACGGSGELKIDEPEDEMTGGEYMAKILADD